MKTLPRSGLLHLCTFNLLINFITAGSDDGHRKPETKEPFQVKHGTESSVAGVTHPQRPRLGTVGDWPICSCPNSASVVDAWTCVNGFDVDIN